MATGFRSSGRRLRRASSAGLLGLLIWGAAAQAAPGLISVEELAALRAAADAGSEPYADDRRRLLEDARRPWRWGSVSGEFVTSGSSDGKTCHPRSDPGAGDYLTEAASDAYVQVLGAHLADDASLASLARSHVLDLVDTWGFRGLTGDYDANNQCILELAVSVPIWIETARLLAGTSVWSADDGNAFRGWLESEVFPRVAWASRVRRNNWGAAGSLAAWAIATEVTGTPTSLEEFEPERRTLSPAAAAAAHLDMQVRRVGNTWTGDARCAQLGIQPHGGIPEELRRGSTGCSGTYLESGDDPSRTYQSMHAELLVLHAELLRRRGDLALYELEVGPGVPAILQAILFVIDNPSPGGVSRSWPSSREGTLIVASGFYDHPGLAGAAATVTTFRGGRTTPYARVTHRPLPGTAAGSGSTIVLDPPGKPRLTWSR